MRARRWLAQGMALLFGAVLIPAGPAQVLAQGAAERSGNTSGNEAGEDQKQLQGKAREGGAASDGVATPVANRLIIATSTSFDTLDPHVVLDTSRTTPQLNFYDALFRWQDNPVRVAPWLAQSYTLSEDGKVFRFTLRKDVRFHDGTEIKASDVVYSVERILALKRGVAPLLAGLVNPGSTKAIDASTVEFSLSRPSSLFLTLLPSVQVVNAALLKSHEVNNDWGRAWLASNEAGSGPYQLVRFNSGSNFVARRSETYWSNTWGRKPIDEIEIRTLFDPDVAIDKLIKGEIHVVDGPLLPHHKRRVRAAKEVALLEDEAPRIFVGLLNSARETLKTPGVRQIIGQAFDYDAFMRSALGAGSTRIALPLPPAFVSPALAAATVSQQLDLEAAKGALAKLKTPIRDLTIGAILGDPHSERAAALMAQGLLRLGIQPRIITEPWPAVAQRMTDEKQMYDILFLWQGARYLDANNWVGEMYDCDLLGAGNSSWYCNKDVDVLLKEARTSADAKARSAGYEKAAAKVAQDSGGLFIASSRATAAFARRLKGLRFAPIGETFELRMLSME